MTGRRPTRRMALLPSRQQRQYQPQGQELCGNPTDGQRRVSEGRRPSRELTEPHPRSRSGVEPGSQFSGGPGSPAGPPGTRAERADRVRSLAVWLRRVGGLRLIRGSVRARPIIGQPGPMPKQAEGARPTRPGGSWPRALPGGHGAAPDLTVRTQGRPGPAASIRGGDCCRPIWRVICDRAAGVVHTRRIRCGEPIGSMEAGYGSEDHRRARRRPGRRPGR